MHTKSIQHSNVMKNNVLSHLKSLKCYEKCNLYFFCHGSAEVKFTIILSPYCFKIRSLNNKLKIIQLKLLDLNLKTIRYVNKYAKYQMNEGQDHIFPEYKECIDIIYSKNDHNKMQ